MKGITPVIAIILLLLITISMVGFAFVWFNRMMISTTNTTTESLEAQTGAMSKTIRIDSVTTSTVSVRNTGSKTIATTEMSVYVAGTIDTVCGAAWVNIAPGAVATCSISCTTGQAVRVTAPGNYDEVSC